MVKIVDFDYVISAYHFRHQLHLRGQCQISSNSMFYMPAEIHNLQEDRNKINIGSNTHVRGILTVFAFGGKIEIGDNCYIGEGTRIWSAEKVQIGNNVLIAHNSNIIDTDSHEVDYLERSDSYVKMIARGHSRVRGNVMCEAVVIEDYVWISYNVTILKGVRIGLGSIVGAGSVVTKDVPPFVLVAGNPAVVKKKLVEHNNSTIC